MISLEPKLERVRPKIERLRTKIEAFDLDQHTILRAFALSLAFHLLLFGTWKMGNHYGLWQRSLAPRWLERILRLPAPVATAAKKNPPPVTREVPLLFVDVDPRQALAEPPKDAKYYSALNTRAANPDTRINANVPKIDGNQTRVIKTFDQPKPATPPPAPAPTPLKPAPEKKPEPEQLVAKPKPAPAPGNLTTAKPQEKPRDDNGQSDVAKSEVPEVHQRPRTLAEARRLSGGLAGERMKQEGGVKHFDVQSSLDTRRTEFGAYAAKMVYAVQQRWYNLLDERGYALERSGKVVLRFRLNQDGTITQMKVEESNVGEFYTLLCEKAIKDPSPYDPWPRSVRLELGGTYKEVTFTFFYN
ncbi:MAG: hypothetical protein ACYDH9_17195 [Limisphaerales bacterium]